MSLPKLHVVNGFDGYWIILDGVDGTQRMLSKEAIPSEPGAYAVAKAEKVRLIEELKQVGPDVWCKTWNVPKESLGGKQLNES